MQVKLDLKILLFLILFHFTGQIKIYILLMIFAFIHEIGHLFVGLILGFKTEIFDIKPIGFSITFNSKTGNLGRKIGKGYIYDLKNICVYLSGPIINMLVAVLIYLTNGNMLYKEELIYINLIIAFVNLLPIYPLDGGRIIKGLLNIFCGFRKSEIYTERISWATMIMILAVSSILVLKVRNFALLIMIIYMLYIRIRVSLKKCYDI